MQSQSNTAIQAAPEFRLIVAGGRDFDDYDRLSAELFALAENELGPYAVSIVSGLARGADHWGREFALREQVQLYEFPADWDNVDVPGAVVRTNRNGRQYNARAGIDRNHQMGDFADGLIAFWDGKSRGTKDMIEYMQSLEKPVRVVRY